MLQHAAAYCIILLHMAAGYCLHKWKTEEQDKEKRAEEEEGEKKGEIGKIRDKDKGAKGANVIWTLINSIFHGVVVCRGCGV